MRRRDVFSLAGECSLLLFASAGAVGAYSLWRDGVDSYAQYGIALAVPATASILLSLAAEVVPNLVAPGRIAFPLNLTLPAVYVPLMLVSQILWTSHRGSIEATPEVLLPAIIWSNPKLLAYAFVAQVLLLTLIAVSRKKVVDD